MNHPSHIRINQLAPSLPFSKATIWRKVKQGTFPKPIKLSANITAWRTVDIQVWFSQCGGDFAGWLASVEGVQNDAR